MDWRSWVYQVIMADGDIVSIVGEDGVVGAGAIEGSVFRKPFIVIVLEENNPGPFPGSATQDVTVWVHDKPGDYLRINGLLKALRSALVGQVASQGAVSCVWQGESSDLADESLGTITRNASFRFNQVEVV